MENNFPGAPGLKGLTVGNLMTNNSNETNITGMTMGGAGSTKDLAPGTIGNWQRSEGNKIDIQNVIFGDPESRPVPQASTVKDNLSQKAPPLEPIIPNVCEIAQTNVTPVVRKAMPHVAESEKLSNPSHDSASSSYQYVNQMGAKNASDYSSITKNANNSSDNRGVASKGDTCTESIETITDEEDKIHKLKEMVIGYWILKEINDNVWTEYDAGNDVKWIEEEGLKILLSGEVMEMIKEKSEEEVHKIFSIFIHPHSVSSCSVQHLLVQLCTSMSDRIDSGTGDWNRHRVIWWVVGRMVMCADGLSEETWAPLMKYFVKIIEQCDDMKTVKCATLTLNRSWLKGTLSKEKKDQIVEALRSHTSYLSQVNITGHHENVDLERYQVGWCAQWAIDNELVDEEQVKQMPLVKLSHDRCGVRNDTHIAIPVRSSFQVKSGTYFYEAILLTDGEMRFGWATREAEFFDGPFNTKKLGDDKHSIGLKVGLEECLIYHNGKQKILSMSARLSVNVIGCLIDLDNRQFVFYLNGEQLEFSENIHFSSSPYYPTASLSLHQQCIFNFGQEPFKFAPKDIQISDFNDEREIHIQKFQLTETAEYRGYYWFRQSVIVNHVDLFYCDPQQVLCDRLVKTLEHTEHNKATRLDHTFECGRLIQSVIEVVGRRLTCDYNDLLTNWVREAFQIIKFSDFKVAKLLEMLYYYHQLPINSPLKTTKCHNYSTILIRVMFCCQNHFLNYLAEQFEQFDSILSNSVETFELIFNPKTFIIEPLRLIATFNSLELFSLPQTKFALKDNRFLLWCSELFGNVSSVSRLYEPDCDLVRLKAGMCARWFREHVMQAGEQHFPSQSTLNPQDKTKHIKLSGDCLSARNNYRGSKMQCVRSMSSASTGTFYYEAILFTTGSMRIGWTTKETQFARNDIGLDKYSIGFDGSKGYSVYQDWKNIRKNSMISKFTNKSKWSVGDVVGCLIDFKEKIFQFSCNGKNIKLQKKSKTENFNFSSEPYYASVSLTLQQHCYLNLGQCDFRHPPPVPYRKFHNDSPAAPLTPLYSPHLTECYSQVQVLARDRVGLMFDDAKQKESDKLADKIQNSISNNEKYSVNLTVVEQLRFLQSLISISGPMLSGSCLSVNARWIACFITKLTSVNLSFSDLVAQLLYPYFTLHFTNDTTITHRNVCMVLSSLITLMGHDLKVRVNLYKQVLTYCTQIVLNCDSIADEWILIFALVCLENLDLSDNDKQIIRSNKKFCKELESRCCYDYSLAESYYKISKFTLRQADFCCQWFLYRVLGINLKLPDSTNRAALNPLDKSSRLKLSSDLLSARSDWHWQSVRSTSSTISSNIYFEVTLITSGPMRIGWTNNYNQTPDCKVGDNNNSIAFDGYTRRIWHDGKSYTLKNGEPRWKAGDVVGCMIDVSEKKFLFYLNDRPIDPERHPKTYFHSKAYFAAVSLSTHQQCHFNFGQSTFRHSPKQPSYIDFKYPNIPSTSGTSLPHATNINLAGAQIGNYVSNIAYKGDINNSDFKFGN